MSNNSHGQAPVHASPTPPANKAFHHHRHRHRHHHQPSNSNNDTTLMQRANKESIGLHSYSALSGGGRSLGPNDEGSSCMTLSANARSSPRGRSTRERKGAEECVPYLLDGEDEVLVLLVKHDDGHLHAAKLADARGWAWSATTQHAAISPPCSWGSEPRATVSRSEGRRKKLTTAGTCRTGSPAGSHPSPQPAP